MLAIGQAAPFFVAPTVSSPEFVFDTAGGRYVLMLFLPTDERLQPALQALATHQRLFDDVKAAAFVVMREPDRIQGVRDLRGLRWISDRTGAITRHYGPDAHWLLLDPALRTLATWPIESADEVFARVAALPPVEAHAGVPLHAPVLIVPRVFEPELCEALIARHQESGGEATGVMRDAGDRTVAVMDELKRRRDIWIDDPDLRAGIQARLERRLYPMIAMGLGFTVTHIERFLVSCYDAADGGVFHAHRDNTTQGTAHRKFACSLNLNDDFEGGDLRLPEFGPQTYRAPPGGAVVFSCGLMHEATAVRRGRRYAFLPFFFDDAGAQVLAAYQARVAAAETVSA
ncbi:MAG: 2OG-Fe(II) oxygenase [Phenylobacterium sp.]|uniref:2OG-Fe(II) oxygenase n=1 Tax=Phenylobacterium sp. TaxID=1871053 RepID=UPI001A4E417E|nr:2OG-Fe(II) oxygenase [Phenylobacterium sp.]MBL8771302.1 2OG-Fe(II) oxygenase [Phenylobacterium sp.]